MTYNPVAALIGLVRHDVREDYTRLVVLTGLNVVCQLAQLLDGVWLDIIVVEMVKQDVETFLSVDNVCFELLRGLRLDALHVRVENIKDALRASGNV